MALAKGTELGPYVVDELLGFGGMGEVYRATDERLARSVALKIVRRDSVASETAVRRFLREARTASALAHPNIITVFDVGEFDEGRFIVMELIRGRTLGELMREGIAIDTLAHIGAQVSKALAVAHGAGIVHRDIKPDNVMVREDGYVKVLDFGLALLGPTSVVDASDETTMAGGRLTGTINYMSPEQARGETVSSATDIFSLGVVLYEAATRTHPFRAASNVDTLHRIISKSVVLPTRINPELDTRFEDLLLAMLQKDPHLRPRADEIDAVLTTLARQQLAAEPVVWTPATRRTTVGQESERAELRRGFDVAAKTGLLLGISGEAGAGKTTLVEDFLTHLEEGGGAVYIGRGRCSERLAGSEAYLPFVEALESLLRQGGGGSAARTFRLVAPTWYQHVAPSVSEESSPEQLLPDIKSASQERLKRELAVLLEELSRLRPLILFFDDFHWADASTVDLLSYLGSRLATMRILIVVTYRPSELALTDSPFGRVKLELRGRQAFREVAMQPLTGQHVSQLLAKQFPENRFPAAFSDLIHAKTEGHPLFIVDLLRDLRQRDFLADVDGTWELGKPLHEIESELPATVRSMIELKIRRLDDLDRKLLACASVQGYEFDSFVVARTLKLDPADTEERLNALERLHAFVQMVGEHDLPSGDPSVRYRFVHGLYQNALFASLMPSRKRQLASAVAETLERAFGERSATVASQLAFLFETSRNAPMATRYYLTAAQRAAAVFANCEAVALGRRGLELLRRLPEGTERDRLELGFLLTMGSPLMSTEGYGSVDGEWAFSRAREISERCGERALSFMMLDALSVIRVSRGDLQTSHKAADELLRMARQIGEPTMLTEAHWVAALPLWMEGKYEAAREHCVAGLEAYDLEHVKSDAIVYAIDPAVCCRSGLAMTLVALGCLDQAKKNIDDAVGLAEELRHPESLAYALVLAAQFHQLQRDPHSTLEQAGAALALSTEHGLGQTLVLAGGIEGWARIKQGDVAKGLAQVRESVDRLRAMGSEIARPYYLGLLAEGLLEDDEPREALRTLEEALTEVLRMGEGEFEAELHRKKGHVLLRLERYDDAEESFRQALDVARAQEARGWELRAALDLARVLERRGNREEALHEVSQVYGKLTEGFGFPDLVAARRWIDHPSGDEPAGRQGSGSEDRTIDSSSGPGTDP